MKELMQITKSWNTSRPIFRLQLDDEGHTIDANVSDPIHKYRPTPIDGNPVSVLLCDNYQERFNPKTNQFEIDALEIASSTMQDIRVLIGQFIEKNLGMKNPRQSKLYRWFNHELPNNNEFNDVLVMVYKYIRSFCVDNRMAYRTKDTDNHAENTIALLTAIMEKHAK